MCRILKRVSRGLHVAAAGMPLVEALELRGWAPAPGWRLALAASTGRVAGRHWLRGLALATDAALMSRALPLQLSLNGQQYEERGRALLCGSL